MNEQKNLAMTKEEYIKSCYNEKYIVDSWVYDLVTIDYHDDLKYYVGLEYNLSWPEKDWFYVLLKVYKDNSEPPTIMHDVRVYPDYQEKRPANDDERNLLLEELYKHKFYVERIDDCGYIEYKLKNMK